MARQEPAEAARRIGRARAISDSDLSGACRREAFDDLRQLRNQSEYEALMVELDELRRLLAHADALHEVVHPEIEE